MKYDFTIIGAGVLDVLARPVDASVFRTGSSPAQDIAISFGGDALNEATILGRLGKNVQFMTVLGQDDAGAMILEHLKRSRIPTDCIVQSTDFPTGINLVLVDEHGERSFITNPNSSLRMLAPEHINPDRFSLAPILCFASIFVSPRFTPQDLAVIFRQAKERGCIVCADMTKRKHQETLDDLSRALSYVDYIFPNYEEACLISGKQDPDEAADAFLAHGVGCVVIKLGAHGCLVKTASKRYLIPAWPHTNCIDTTGAGDNFAAGFLYALSEKMQLFACAQFANAAASIAVESVGATTGIQSLEQILPRFARMSRNP